MTWAESSPAEGTRKYHWIQKLQSTRGRDKSCAAHKVLTGSTRCQTQVCVPLFHGNITQRWACSEMAPEDVNISASTRERWQWTPKFPGSQEPGPKSLWQGERQRWFLSSVWYIRKLVSWLCARGMRKDSLSAHTVLCFIAFCKSGARHCLAQGMDGWRNAMTTLQEILGKQANNSRCLACLL